MQIENDYDKDVYNGDIGFVRAIDAELGDVTIEFDGRFVRARRSWTGSCSPTRQLCTRRRAASIRRS